MTTKYFSGIHFRQSEFPGFYAIEYGGRSYYACAYRDRLRGKAALTELLKTKQTSPQYYRGEFDFHHIVERPHLADISCSGDEVDRAYPAMPTIMVHRTEHQQFNEMLHIKETRQLYMRSENNLPADVADREKAVRRMLATGDRNEKENAKKEIGQRIEILNQLYRGVYEGNALLKSIASNIFTDYRNRLAMM